MASTQPHPEALHTISGNVHFYEHSDASRQARRTHSTHASSVGRDSQFRRALNAHSSFDYLIPSTRPDENTKDKNKKDAPKPVFLERCLSKNGSAGLESCPAFDYLQPVEWHDTPKDKSTPKHHGWERIPGMLSNTEFDSEKWKHYIERDRKGRHPETNIIIWTKENENAFQIGQCTTIPLGSIHSTRCSCSHCPGRWKEKIQSDQNWRQFRDDRKGKKRSHRAGDRTSDGGSTSSQANLKPYPSTDGVYGL